MSRLRGFHALVVACAAATVIFSWPLWQTRNEPPLLPLLALPSISTGFLLLAALVWALVRPRAGLAAYCIGLAYAILTDWTRLQPAMVSFALLLAATLGPAGIAIARAHLISMWLYAGLHKLLSPEFMAYRGQVSILRGLFAEPPEWLGAIYPELVVATEIGLALAALFVVSRRLAAPWALALHTTILLSLSPWGRNWNNSVWPWNVALGLAGFFLIAPWKEPMLDWFRSANRRREKKSGRGRPRQASPVPFVVVALFFFPALSQFGIGDPYLAHHLYSRSTPISYVCRDDHIPPPRPGLGDGFESNDGRFCRFVDYFPWLDVPEPGEHAFVRAYFTETCVAGETLLIRERRRFFIATGREWARSDCGA